MAAPKERVRVSNGWRRRSHPRQVHFELFLGRCLGKDMVGPRREGRSVAARTGDDNGRRRCPPVAQRARGVPSISGAIAIQARHRGARMVGVDEKRPLARGNR